MPVITTHIYVFLLLWGTNVQITQNLELKEDAYLKSTELLEIQGIIIDNTQTKIGKDFFDLFYREWNSNNYQSEFPVKIQEITVPSLGTRISVLVNDEIIFQSFVRPNYDEIEQAATAAVYRTMAYLSSYEQIKNNLEGEDLMGTGIY